MKRSPPCLRLRKGCQPEPVVLCWLVQSSPSPPPPHDIAPTSAHHTTTPAATDHLHHTGATMAGPNLGCPPFADPRTSSPCSNIGACTNFSCACPPPLLSNTDLLTPGATCIVPASFVVGVYSFCAAARTLELLAAILVLGLLFAKRRAAVPAAASTSSGQTPGPGPGPNGGASPPSFPRKSFKKTSGVGRDRESKPKPFWKTSEWLCVLAILESSLLVTANFAHALDANRTVGSDALVTTTWVVGHFIQLEFMRMCFSRFLFLVRGTGALTAEWQGRSKLARLVREHGMAMFVGLIVIPADVGLVCLLGQLATPSPWEMRALGSTFLASIAFGAFAGFFIMFRGVVAPFAAALRAHVTVAVAVSTDGGGGGGGGGGLSGAAGSGPKPDSRLEESRVESLRFVLLKLDSLTNVAGLQLGMIVMVFALFAAVDELYVWNTGVMVLDGLQGFVHCGMLLVLIPVSQRNNASKAKANAQVQGEKSGRGSVVAAAA